MGHILRWIRQLIKLLIPYALAAFLIAVWVETEMHPTRETPAPGTRLAWHLFVVVVLLGVIFFADAMEVAYSLLRYKHIEQFSGTTARILKQMHDKEILVYEAREWLVTILIVAITLLLEFDAVYSPFSGKQIVFPAVPGFPPISAAKFFSLLFGTLPVLWLAQGPSKRVARECPQKMLDAGVLVWLFIKLVGWFTSSFGLEDPTERVANLMMKDDGFRDEANLKPSDHAYFIASVERYGYALHDISVHITIGPNGSCQVKQCVLYYVIARPYNVFARKLKLETPSSGFTPERSEAYRMPVLSDTDPNGNKDLFDKLEGIVSRSPETLRTIEKLEVSPNIFATSDPSNKLRQIFSVDTHGAIPEDAAAFALFAEYTSDWCDGAFKVPPEEGDFFYTSFNCPCYCYRLTVETADECRFLLSDVSAEAICGENLHWGEQDRLQRSLGLDPASPNAIHCELHYPFPGTDYYVRWKNVLEPVFNSPCGTGARGARSVAAQARPAAEQNSHEGSPSAAGKDAPAGTVSLYES